MKRGASQRAVGGRLDGGRWGRFIVPAVVAVVTIVVFAPSLGHDFVDSDDPVNFTHNPGIRGLGLSQLRWCWTATLLGVYQPVSWMFAAIVYLVGGVRPVAFHAANLGLHVASAVVFCAVVVRLLRLGMAELAAEAGGGVWVWAGLAAALFAVHPLRVETVAWATCQPYTLAVFFSLLTLLTYLRAQDPSGRAATRKWWVAASVLLCVLAMLSKASTMTLPVVLLILDVYPLRRLGGSDKGWTSPAARAVYREKLLFFVPALATGCAAVWASRTVEVTASLEEFGVGGRLAQAAYGLAFGVGKTAVPVHLWYFYPPPAELNPWEGRFVLSELFAGTLTGIAVLLRRRWPGLLAVWVCYAAVLVPVIGVVPHGLQLTADRYTYLSCLGWPVLIAAGVLRWWAVRVRVQPAAAYGMVVVASMGVVALAFLARRQTGVWRDSHALWSHAVARDPSSHVAQTRLAEALAQNGQYQEAIAHYERAIELDATHAAAHRGLGHVLYKLGRVDEAIACYERALAISPNNLRALNNLGVALRSKGRLDQAIECFRRALHLNPAYSLAHVNRGMIYANLGMALARKGRNDEAIEMFRTALELKPDDAATEYHLGNALARSGDLSGAVEHLERAIALRPNYVEALNNLGATLTQTGQWNAAIGALRNAVKHAPDDATTAANLAWVLATCPEQALRDGPTAVRLAERACRADGYENPRLLDTLAAAYAEAGRFQGAVTTARRALRGARQRNADRLARDILARLRLYESRQPFHESR